MRFLFFGIRVPISLHTPAFLDFHTTVFFASGFIDRFGENGSSSAFSIFFSTCSTSSTLEPGGPDTRCWPCQWTSLRCSRLQWPLCLPPECVHALCLLLANTSRLSDVPHQRGGALSYQHSTARFACQRQQHPKAFLGQSKRRGAVSKRSFSHRFSFLLKSLLDSRVHIWCYLHGH